MGLDTFCAVVVPGILVGSGISVAFAITATAAERKFGRGNAVSEFIDHRQNWIAAVAMVASLALGGI